MRNKEFFSFQKVFYICTPNRKRVIRMNNRDYHADTTRISKSGLDLFSRSPRHYYAKYLDPNRVQEQPTKALILGSAVHTAILEPHKFSDEYAVEPVVNKRTNQGKEEMQLFLAANAAKTIIDVEIYDQAMRARDAVYKHGFAAELLSIGKAEQTIFFEDAESGARCKCRPDFITSDGLIVDIKTTQDASPEAFGRSSYNYRYHVQAAFYSQGYEEEFSKPPEAFVFIAVETLDIFEVAVYYASVEDLILGRETYRPELSRYQACVNTGLWPGYGEEIQRLQLPYYAFKKLNTK